MFPLRSFPFCTCYHIASRRNLEKNWTKRFVSRVDYQLDRSYLAFSQSNKNLISTCRIFDVAHSNALKICV